MTEGFDLGDAAPWVAARPGGVGVVVAWRAVDGSRRLATSGNDGVIQVWDADSREPIAVPGFGRPVHSALLKLVAWRGPHGVRLASAGGGPILVWDPETGGPVGAPLADHTSWVSGLTVWTAADGSARLASASADGTVRVWDPEAGQAVGGPLVGHVGAAHDVTSWTVSDGGVRLASVDDGGTIRIWDPDSGKLIGTVRTGQVQGLGSLASWTESDGRIRLAFGRADGTVELLDPDSAKAGERLIGHRTWVHTLTVWTNSDGRTRLGSASMDGTIRIWDPQAGTAVGQPITGGQTAGTQGGLATAEGHTMVVSAGDDGMICRWDGDAVGAYGEPIQGHAGWIPSMTMWHALDGTPRLASGGADATIRVWDSHAGVTVATLDTSRVGCTWVLALTAWTTPDGGTRVAFAGNDPSVYIWHLDDGAIDVLPAGHTGWIRALTTWVDGDGRRRLASGGVDGTIRIWDADASTATGDSIAAHTGWVRVLVTWTGSDGRTLLASAGADDATIRVWDPRTGAAIGAPLTGHRVGVWALTTWTMSDGRIRLASTGRDGTIRLWDPQTGHALRTIEVGPVTVWGMSDVATAEDVLDRQRLADAIADQLDRSSRTAPAATDGPLVVSIEGPWGSGKSTLMKLVRRRLTERRGPPALPQDATRPLTVRDSLGLIRRYPNADRPTAAPADAVAPRGIVTVWFNPWMHQSGEQVWAGLAHEIIEAVSEALYPTERARQRYWFTRNLARTDRYRLRRALHRRVVSPLLGVALAAIVAQLAIALAEFNKPINVFGHTITATTVALAVTASFLFAGLAHTAARYLWDSAAHHLPAEIFHGPVNEGLTADSASPEADISTDPLRRARAGALYMYQHDIGEVIGDLSTLGYDLVVFVDDIDRCRPSASVEVFEAVNLFLSGVASGSGPQTHFVIGLDPQVVARHLDQLYETTPNGADPGLDQHRVPTHGDDPSPGWAFLRKLIQLPVIVPQVTDSGIERFVDQVTTPTASPAATPGPTPTAPTQARVPKPRAGSPSPTSRSQPAATTSGPPAPAVPATPVDTIVWRTMERHPDVRATLVRRLTAQPDRSLREAKRLINVWQLYARLYRPPVPGTQPAAAIKRAQHLIVLAEIVTRWPALQRPLHQRVDNQRGLQILADCAENDEAWSIAVQQLNIHPGRHYDALNNLRSLLREHDGATIAHLADLLL